METKMSDNEIIKALKGSILNAKRIDCKAWSLEVYKLENALDLINRQKAEIERLSIESATLVTQLKGAYEQIHKLNMTKSEAIKKFAEELKNYFSISECYLDIINIIDNLVKEMTE